MDNLIFRPVARRPPGPGQVEIRIHATGLNFRDVLATLGEYPGDPGHLGHECSGEVVAVGPGVTDLAVGDRVLALAHGSFARFIAEDARLVARMEKLTVAEAATIPVAFLTAYLGLHELARIEAGTRVLIHAATGGVGQAAIQIAQKAGAEVFATASPEKMDLLRQRGLRHIYSSRDIHFADRILSDTRGEGVEVVLNSLTGPGFVEASLRALGKNGSLIELSKRDARSPDAVHRLRPDVIYRMVNLGEVRRDDPASIARMLGAIMPDFEGGRLEPLAQSIFDFEAARSAFRHMQQARHTGKIVLTLTPAWGPAESKRSMAFCEGGSYLITGGLGGLGFLVACWMIERGARHLILLGRTGAGEPIRAKLAELEAAGASVQVVAGDVTDAIQVARAVADTPYPLRGIVHAAGVLDDGLLINQAWSRFETVLAPKVRGGWILHELSRDHPLDFFVLFSSAASLLGSAGQTNHAAANAGLDALAHFRRGRGLPAQSINWGAWSDVGTLASRRLEGILAERGLGTISPEAGLQVLDQVLRIGAPQIGVIPVRWSQFLGACRPGDDPPSSPNCRKRMCFTAPPRPR